MPKKNPSGHGVPKLYMTSLAVVNKMFVCFVGQKKSLLNKFE